MPLAYIVFNDEDITHCRKPVLSGSCTVELLWPRLTMHWRRKKMVVRGYSITLMMQRRRRDGIH